MNPQKKALIRPSVLDIFFGVPKLKPIKKPAVAAKTTPASPPAAPPPTPPPPPPPPPAPEPAAPPPPAPDPDPAPAPTPTPPKPRAWVPSDDKKLQDLKDAGATWKEISGAMERPLHDIKRRHGDLRRARARAEKKKAADDQAAKEKELNESTTSTGMRVPFLQADENWTKDELILLLEIATRYEDTKWLYIASGFYDKTGKRVSARAVKEKLGG